jgi:hypothetical protein
LISKPIGGLPVPEVCPEKGGEVMSWRRHKSHREETKAVKQALAQAGIRVKQVSHGRGTAWSWLEINLGAKAPRELQEKALRIAQDVTGRHGEYHGEILILTQ